MILITGATGSNGREIVRELLAKGSSLRAMVRPGTKQSGFEESNAVEVVAGDFDDRASLERALHGIERAFLLTPSSERAEAQQIGFVDAAKAAGVQHLVVLSQFASRADSPVRFLRYHAAVEEAVRRSGLAWTFLRPNLYMQGLFQFKQMIKETGGFAAAIGDARVSLVDVRDNAAAAAAALTQTGHESRIFDLTGPEALTHTELAEKLSTSADRRITFSDVSEGAMGDALRRAGMPAWQVDGLLEDYAHYRRGEAAAVCTGVIDATGAAPRSFSNFAADYADAWR